MIISITFQIQGKKTHQGNNANNEFVSKFFFQLVSNFVNFVVGIFLTKPEFFKNALILPII